MEGVLPSSTHPLSQVPCVFLLNLLQRISAQPSCRQEEFPVGDECCPMCNPGGSSKEAVLCQGGTPVLSLWASGSSVQWLHSIQFRDHCLGWARGIGQALCQYNQRVSLKVGWGQSHF